MIQLAFADRKQVKTSSESYFLSKLSKAFFLFSFFSLILPRLGAQPVSKAASEDSIQINLLSLRPVDRPRMLRNDGGNYQLSSRFVARGEHGVAQGWLFFKYPEDESSPEAVREPHDHSEIRAKMRPIGSERMNASVKLNSFQSEELHRAYQQGDWSISVPKQDLIKAIRERRKELFDDLSLHEEEKKIMEDIEFWDKSILAKIPGLDRQADRRRAFLENFRNNRQRSKMSLSDALIAETMSLEVCAREIDLLSSDYSCAWIPVSKLLERESVREHTGYDRFVLSPGDSHGEMLNLGFEVKGSWISDYGDRYRFETSDRIPKRSPTTQSKGNKQSSPRH